MLFYTTGAFLVFSISLRAFFKDSSTSKTDLSSWLVVVFATLFWPLVLPSILYKKFFKTTPELNTQAS